MLKVEIYIKGLLDTCWIDWFNGLEMHHTETGETVLQGYVQDLGVFYGILTKLRDMGLKLLLVGAEEMGEIYIKDIEKGCRKYEE